MLNAKLAATDSMTHDVIRDMLGVKMNMTTWAVKNDVSLILIYAFKPLQFCNICLLYCRL
jgi:hypothetical protein